MTVRYSNRSTALAKSPLKNADSALAKSPLIKGDSGGCKKSAQKRGFYSLSLYKVIFLCFWLLSFSACTSIKQHKKPYISKDGELPGKVAILPFVNKTSNPEAGKVVRKMFCNFFSSLNYQDTEPAKVDSRLKEAGLYEKVSSGADVSLEELKRLLNTDAVVFGEVTSFGKVFAIVYTDYHAGLKSKMVACRTGNLIWENHTTAHQRDISIPTGPISLAAAIAEKLVLLNMKQMDDMKVTALLCMKLIETIPNPPEIAELGPKIEALVHNGANKLLKPGESLKVVLVGEPGQIANWDILPIVRDLPMEEKEPGTYIGEYTVKSGDKLFSGELVGYLTSKGGERSRWVDMLGPVYMGEPTSLPQQISADLVLSAGNSPYLVEETLFVMSGAKLIIESGAVIWCKGLGIVVKGEIEAKGTQEKPIRFMNIESEPWKGIIIDQGEGTNVFSHCEVYNAQNGIRARASVVNIDNCLFQNNTVGMFLEEGTATVSKSIIRASREVGIHTLKSQITIKDSTVSENELGGILLDSAKGYMSYNNIYNNGKWELKVEGAKMPCNITHNWWGGTDTANIRIEGQVEIKPVLREPIKTF